MVQTNTDTQRAAENINAHYQEFLTFMQNVGQTLLSGAVKKVKDFQQGVQITKGKRNRVIYGQTSRGFRNELTNQDLKILKDLVRETPVPRDRNERKGNNYEIKFGGDVLFRQEQDGAVTINRAAQLGFVKDLDAGVATLQDYSEAFAPLEELKGDQSLDLNSPSREAIADTTAVATEEQKNAALDLSGVVNQNEKYEHDVNTFWEEDYSYPNSSIDEETKESVIYSAEVAPEKRDVDLSTIDSDRDGLSDGEEIARATDPQSADTDGDGKSDLSEIQSRNDPVVGSDIAENNLLNREAQAVQKIVNRIQDRSVREIFSELANKISESISHGVTVTLEKINPYSQVNQELAAAKTAISLLEDNFQKTGETEYVGVNYNIFQQGYNEYRVEDKQGNLKLSFERDSSQIKINSVQFEGKDYQNFHFANGNLNKNREQTLNGEMGEKIFNLKGLAKESDRSLFLDLEGKQVVEIAADFLHYVGAKHWDRNDGLYSIESDNQSFLTIKAKDGRGTILSYGGGQLQQNLSSKDINYFKELNQNMQGLISQKQQNKQQHFEPQIRREQQPSIHKERELSI